jgi:predicted transcriptional regulator
MQITDVDKVTLALILEEGKARINELQFHLTLTKKQISKALNKLQSQGKVQYEIKTGNYRLII